MALSVLAFTPVTQNQIDISNANGGTAFSPPNGECVRKRTLSTMTDYSSHIKVLTLRMLSETNITITVLSETLAQCPAGQRISPRCHNYKRRITSGHRPGV